MRSYLFSVRVLGLVGDDVLAHGSRGRVPVQEHGAVSDVCDPQLSRGGHGHCGEERDRAKGKRTQNKTRPERLGSRSGERASLGGGHMTYLHVRVTP